MNNHNPVIVVPDVICGDGIPDLIPAEWDETAMIFEAVEWSHRLEGGFDG